MENKCSNGCCPDVLTPEMKMVLEKAPYLALATVSSSGQPHLIIIGKVKEIRDDGCLALGVYRMNQTRKNIEETGMLQLAAAFEKKGYRFIGNACVKENEVIFNITCVESLL